MTTVFRPLEIITKYEALLLNTNEKSRGPMGLYHSPVLTSKSFKGSLYINLYQTMSP